MTSWQIDLGERDALSRPTQASDASSSHCTALACDRWVQCLRGSWPRLAHLPDIRLACRDPRKENCKTIHVRHCLVVLRLLSDAVACCNEPDHRRFRSRMALLVHAALSTQSHTLLLPLVITAHRRAPARTPVALASRQLRSRRAAPCWQQRRLHHTCARKRTLKVNPKLLYRGERAPRPACLRVQLNRCCEAAARSRQCSSVLSAQRANFSPS